jgi:protein-S-isoprenylcysteine O-methyltransferase Ste14
MCPWQPGCLTAASRPVRRSAFKLGLVLFLLAILAVCISQTKNDGWLTLWFLLFIFVAVPLLILSWVDLGRAIRGAENPTRLLLTLGVIFGLPQALLGIFAIICGVSIVGWVLYNSFVKRQSEYSGGFLTFGIGPALAVFGWLWLREAFVRSRNSTSGMRSDFGHESGREHEE